MSKILLIGNSGDKAKHVDGQTAKVRLYRDILKEEDVSFNFIDLEAFFRHPLSILFSIKKYIKMCDNIVLLTASRGSKILIPYINFLNRRYKRKFIFPMIGMNILHKYIDTIDANDFYDFIYKCDFKKIKPTKKDLIEFKKITLILPENNTIKKVISSFFGLTNVEVLQNFRNYNKTKKIKKIADDYLNVVYVSRIVKEKGIFELISAIKSLIKDDYKVRLYIYGKIYLNAEERIFFLNSLDENIVYKGSIDNSDVIDEISKYDLFAFPTLYRGEGTPGVIAEAFIAGLPILSSNFVQAESLLKNDFDSIIYDSSDPENLKLAILKLLKNKRFLNLLAHNAALKGKTFLYSNNKNAFLKYIVE